MDAPRTLLDPPPQDTPGLPLRDPLQDSLTSGAFLRTVLTTPRPLRDPPQDPLNSSRNVWEPPPRTFLGPAPQDCLRLPLGDPLGPPRSSPGPSWLLFPCLPIPSDPSHSPQDPPTSFFVQNPPIKVKPQPCPVIGQGPPAPPQPTRGGIWGGFRAEPGPGGLGGDVPRAAREEPRGPGSRRRGWGPAGRVGGHPQLSPGCPQGGAEVSWGGSQ